MITDLQFIKFLSTLRLDQRKRNPIVLTEWEQHFFSGWCVSSQSPAWFTGDLKTGRRAAVDRMWRRYGAEIGLPHPLDTVTERPPIPQADPTGCEYLVKDAGSPQRRCNEPAEFREPGRLRYCKMHAEAVEIAMKRAKKSFCLVKFP